MKKFYIIIFFNGFYLFGDNYFYIAEPIESQFNTYIEGYRSYPSTIPEEY